MQSLHEIILYFLTFNHDALRIILIPAWQRWQWGNEEDLFWGKIWVKTIKERQRTVYRHHTVPPLHNWWESKVGWLRGVSALKIPADHPPDTHPPDTHPPTHTSVSGGQVWGDDEYSMWDEGLSWAWGWWAEEMGQYGWVEREMEGKKNGQRGEVVERRKGGTGRCPFGLLQVARPQLGSTWRDVTLWHGEVGVRIGGRWVKKWTGGRSAEVGDRSYWGHEGRYIHNHLFTSTSVNILGFKSN